MKSKPPSISGAKVIIFIGASFCKFLIKSKFGICVIGGWAPSLFGFIKGPSR